MDDPAPRLQALAAAIVEELAAGITLQADVLAFLEGMTGEVSASALQALLQEDGAAGQSTLDLIFFPERPLRRRVEPLLGQGLSPEEAQCLVDALVAHGCPTPLQFPEGDSLSVSPPRWVLERMVARLRLARRIPSQILQQLAETLGQDKALPYRTLLRTTRFAWSESVTTFLLAFLKRASCAPGQDKQFLAQFQTALAFLEEAPLGQATYEQLMRRKQFYHAAMDKARNYSEMARQLPMEALLSRGVTPPVMTREEALQRIQRLDALSLTIFGRTDPLDSPVHEAVPYDPDMLPEEG